MNDIPAPDPVRGSRMILEGAGRRYVTGQNLTIAETNMSVIASAQENANKFGPGPQDFTVSTPDIPESVKGSLVSHGT